jgi:hypothetical protein
MWRRLGYRRRRRPTLWRLRCRRARPPVRRLGLRTYARLLMSARECRTGRPKRRRASDWCGHVLRRVPDRCGRWRPRWNRPILRRRVPDRCGRWRPQLWRRGQLTLRGATGSSATGGLTGRQYVPTNQRSDWACQGRFYHSAVRGGDVVARGGRHAEAQRDNHRHHCLDGRVPYRSPVVHGPPIEDFQPTEGVEQGPRYRSVARDRLPRRSNGDRGDRLAK